MLFLKMLFTQEKSYNHGFFLKVVLNDANKIAPSTV